MKNDQKRTVLALVLSGIVLFGWQILFAPKQEVQEQITQAATSNATASLNQETQAIPSASNVIGKPPIELKQMSDVALTNGVYSFRINSDFSIAQAVGFETKMDLKKFTGKDNFFKVRVVNSANALEDLNLQFGAVEHGNRVTAVDTGKNITIIFTLNEKGQLRYSITGPTAFKLAYSMIATKEESSNRTYRQFLYFGKTVERITVEDDEKAEDTMKWFGVDFQYHVFANVLSKKEIYKFITTETGEMYIQSLAPVNEKNGYFIFSLKNYDYLSSFKDKVDLAIDFGLFGILAVPILRGMQFLYTYLGNYGWAIIVLTFGIRFLTFPLQYKSFKSMKKMQKVQPELAKIKERYKDDPSRVQKETMALFKRAGANPLGGCLPMLLQVPFFIAFYQAINNSVELVGSPFMLWIFDLSLKDPYYVLPVLMGITMLAQTKLNPSTTTDPNQQKIMYLMPLVFCFIMKDLPAGLNLYFFVSNILGIAQQLYVYKTVD